MSGIASIFLMSLALGAGAFGIGLMPLAFTFSGQTLNALSTVGTGLLLGAALGIIIPEGIETLLASTASTNLPSSTIAFSLLIGFTFMLVVEQLLSGSGHAHFPVPTEPEPPQIPIPVSSEANGHLAHLDKTHRRSPSLGGEDNVNVEEEEYSILMDNLERRTRAGAPQIQPPGTKEGRSKAYALTLGLVVHGLADGFALGASSLPRQVNKHQLESSPSQHQNSSPLSLVVFFAILIHKAPTVLAFATSLLSTSLPRSECKKHLAAFSASTPVSALISYAMLSFIGAGPESSWPGIALLISGGSFLYVATVLQSVSHADSHSHSHSGAGDMDPKVRAGLVIVGMFTPLLITLFVEHQGDLAVPDSATFSPPLT